MLKSDGFFEDTNQRGDQPEPWTKTDIEELKKVPNTKHFKTFIVDKFSVKVPYVMTLHHNVSFEHLKLLWNYLMDRAAGGAPDLLVSYMSDCFKTDVGLASKIVDGFLSTDESKKPTSEQRTDLFNKVTWMGWNLLEGPPSDLRSDDPAETFDDFDTKYLPAKKKNRMTRVRALGDAVLDLRNRLDGDHSRQGKITVQWHGGNSLHGTAAYKGIDASLTAAIAKIDSLQRESFIRFEPEMWEYDPGSGRFNVRRN